MMCRFLLALALLATCPLYAAEWDLGPKRWEVSSDAAEIDEDTGAWMIDLSDFPSSFWESSNLPDGIRAADSDADTEVPVHIIGFTDNGSTGTDWLRVGAGISAGSNDSVFIYLGSGSLPAVDAANGQYAAYDANVAAAYWWNGNTNDSTSNENHLTVAGTPTAVPGPVAGLSGYELNGSSDYFWASTPPISDWPLTIEAWADVDSLTSVFRLANLSSTSSDTPIALLEAAGSDNAQKPRLRVRGDTGSLADANGPAAQYTMTWHHYAGSRSGAPGPGYALLDGVAGGGTGTTITAPTFNRVGIGASVRASVSNYLDGTIGPVLFHNVARSADYLATFRNMILNPGDVYTIGAMEEEPAGDGETDLLELTSVALSTGWTNPTHALTSLANAATYDIPEDTVGNPINLVDLNGAAAEITGQTITGIELQLVATGEDAGGRFLEDETIRLIIGGTVVGDNKAIATQWTDASQVTRIYGGPADLWGLNPADTDITAAGFGVSLAFGDHGNDGAALMSLYRVRIRVYYTQEGAGVSQSTSAFFAFFD